VSSSLAGGGVLNAYATVAAETTDAELAAAIPNQRLRVVAFMINHGDSAASEVTFNSKPAGAGAAIFPALKYPANGGTSTPQAKSGWFQTNVGEGLTVSTGVGSTTSVIVVYQVVS
jgi:hypothetical protein